jgi:MmgE/PrpD C-terminal domain
MRTTTLVSAARQLAYLACDPQRLYDIDRSAPASQPGTDAAIRALEAKVEIVAEPSLAQYYPRHWPAEVEITLADGTSVRERVIEAPGDPERPLGDDGLGAKAHGVLDRLVGREAAVALIDVGRRGLADQAGSRALADAFADWFGAQPRRKETA